MFKRMTITCGKASIICDKSQYGEASLFEKIQLKSHLLMCKICREYVEHNKTMTRIFKMIVVDSEEKVKHCLSSADKKAIKKELKGLIS